MTEPKDKVQVKNEPKRPYLRYTLKEMKSVWDRLWTVEKASQPRSFDYSEKEITFSLY